MISQQYFVLGLSKILFDIQILLTSSLHIVSSFRCTKTVKSGFGFQTIMGLFSFKLTYFLSFFPDSLTVAVLVLQMKAIRTGDLTCTTTARRRIRASSGVLCLNPAVSITR